MARIICVVFLPITLKNLFVNRIVLRIFPALQRATIDMGAKRKPSITGKTDTEPVSIGEGCLTEIWVAEDELCHIDMTNF